MSLLLKDRDYVADGNGGVAVVRDGESLLNETLFRLTARRGSFPFLPELGSRLHLLGRASTRQRETLAGQYVAEALGVSRQAVSKWENGTSDPSTANLMALAKLYGLSVDELLHQTETGE